MWLPEDAPLAATQRRDAQARARERDRSREVGRGEPAPAVADDVRRRRRAALLVLGVARAVAAQLRADADRGERQARHRPSGPSRCSERSASGLPGARVDVRQLEIGAPVGIPVAIRISGEDIADAARPRGRASRRSSATFPTAARVRDNWGPESFTVQLKTDPDRANLVGADQPRVAGASATGDERRRR